MCICVSYVHLLYFYVYLLYSYVYLLHYVLLLLLLLLLLLYALLGHIACNESSMYGHQSFKIRSAPFYDARLISVYKDRLDSRIIVDWRTGKR